MRAVTFGTNGELEISERSVNAPVGDQVLVRVHGAGLNRADLLQRGGHYPAPEDTPADIPGLEFAGRVEQVGPWVRSLQVGDGVLGLVGGGAQAEYVLTSESLCSRTPTQIDLIEAGGIPEAFFTAFDALRQQAGLQNGEQVLIHAIGSGVGIAALQLAKLYGATAIGLNEWTDQARLPQDSASTCGGGPTPDASPAPHHQFVSIRTCDLRVHSCVDHLSGDTSIRHGQHLCRSCTCGI